MKYFVTLLLIAMALVLVNMLTARARARNDDDERVDRAPRKDPGQVEQTELCRTCGTYRAISDESPCNRTECPYR